MNVEVRWYSIIFIEIKRQSDTRSKRLRCASDATPRYSKFLVRYSIFSIRLFVVPIKILNKIFLVPACPGYVVLSILLFEFRICFGLPWHDCNLTGSDCSYVKKISRIELVACNPGLGQGFRASDLHSKHVRKVL